MATEKKNARQRRARKLRRTDMRATVAVTYQDDTTVFCETDPLCAALDELCAELNSWYASMNNPWQREDRAYRKQLAKATRESLKRVLTCEDAPVE